MKKLLLSMCLCCSAPIFAADKANWSATDVAGAKVDVPVPNHASVLAFVRPQQLQSDRVLEQIKSVTTEKESVVAVISGDIASEEAKNVASKHQYPWPVVADPEFKASGEFNVHVWPTVVVVASDGSQVAHLAGLNDTFASDLRAYLDQASGSIDQAALKKRLETHDTVTESTTRMAGSYLQVAKRLMENGDIDQARSQVEQGLKLKADDVSLKLMLARIQIAQRAPADALKVLDTIPAESIPPHQITVLRGRALIALEKWNDAKTILESSTDLNPDPAESQYLLGLVYQHNNDPTKAAEAFRKAYESREKRNKEH